MICNGNVVKWEEYEWGGGQWYVIAAVPFVGYLATANRDGRWNAKRLTTDGRDVVIIGEGEAGNLEAAKAAAEKCLLDNGIVTVAPEVVPAPEKLYYKGKPIDWGRRDRDYLTPEGSNYNIAETYSSGEWYTYRLTATGYEDIDCGRTDDLASAKDAAVASLLRHGIITTKPRVLPTTGAYTFHFRADKGGATVVATVVRGPDTTVLYGVSFCSPRDSFDKNLGRRLAAFRLIDKPLTLVLPGLVGPREIKAAILAALVIPPGNRLVR